MPCRGNSLHEQPFPRTVWNPSKDRLIVSEEEWYVDEDEEEDEIVDEAIHEMIDEEDFSDQEDSDIEEHIPTPRDHALHTDQLRYRAALNGHVFFSHIPKRLGEVFNVEWWYYQSVVNPTSMPMFVGLPVRDLKELDNEDHHAGRFELGKAIHCRDYHLTLMKPNTTSSSEMTISYHDKLSRFWSNYFFDNFSVLSSVGGLQAQQNEECMKDTSSFRNKMSLNETQEWKHGVIQTWTFHSRPVGRHEKSLHKTVPQMVANTAGNMETRSLHRICSTPTEEIAPSQEPHLSDLLDMSQQQELRVEQGCSSEDGKSFNCNGERDTGYSELNSNSSTEPSGEDIKTSFLSTSFLRDQWESLAKEFFSH
ncbi:hypothetical protein C9374_003573 [Naegleria lovaniensis]|uniref:Uncharacterized protein n=1 Tax=Naegleria lovaniensis TaxID=51637 RepID=A0AA88H052_NAELO|nr:uncharacterized protein C9374_003573 [Naegleria lovaniensis]KAG2393809.1 hypothetical protein C9374_003573 [Naegleria lovaniensis]